MSNLDLKQKEELIKTVEFVLRPVNAKFVEFEDPIEMFVSVRGIGDNSSIISDENKILIYHMKIKTDHGEFVMSFSSDDLKDSRWAVNVACAYAFSDKKIIPQEQWREINKRIFDLYRS